MHAPPPTEDPTLQRATQARRVWARSAPARTCPCVAPPGALPAPGAGLPAGSVISSLPSAGRALATSHPTGDVTCPRSHRRPGGSLPCRSSPFSASWKSPGAPEPACPRLDGDNRRARAVGRPAGAVGRGPAQAWWHCRRKVVRGAGCASSRGLILHSGACLSPSRKRWGSPRGPLARPPRLLGTPPHAKEARMRPCPEPRLAWPQMPHQPSLTTTPTPAPTLTPSWVRPASWRRCLGPPRGQNGGQVGGPGARTQGRALPRATGEVQGAGGQRTWLWSPNRGLALAVPASTARLCSPSSH